MAEKMKMGSEIFGAIKKIKFWDPESRCIIAILDTGVTIKGELETDCEFPFWIIRKRIRWCGKWSEHVKHGQQFEFATYIEDRPLGREAVTNWLTKICFGIGPVKANKLYDAYQEDVLHVLMHNPHQSVDDGILDSEEAHDAGLALNNEDGIARTKIELFGLLNGFGFPRKAINRCLEKWGAKAANQVRRDPFRPMVERIPGFGFKRCDTLYLELGKPKKALKRQMLAAWYALSTDSEGNTWHGEGLLRRAILLAVGNKHDLQIDRALELGIRSGWIVDKIDENGLRWFAQASKAQDELQLSRLIREMLEREVHIWVKASEVYNDTSLSEHQKEQLQIATTKAIGILAGTPGTGKTYTVAKLMKHVPKFWRIGACAPTGKAAVRLSENLTENGIPIEATTIHRMLGVQEDRDAEGHYIFKHNEETPLEFDLIFVDESSMVDTSLLCSLMRAIPPRAHILFIGDPYQLPPVGHGAPLRDMIRAGVPCGELTEIRRNAGLIVEACAKIKNGKRFKTDNDIDEDAGRNLRLIPAEEPEIAQDLLKKLLLRFKTSGRYDPVWQTQVLTAVNETSALSRTVINSILQDVLNPITSVSNRSVSGFRIRDKVICLKNSFLLGFKLEAEKPQDDPDSYVADMEPTCDRWSPELQSQHFVANGEIGKVLAVSELDVVMEFPPNRVVKIHWGSRSIHKNSFDLGYAITTHKSQGAEWPCVIVLGDRHGTQVTCREHLYTSISRAKRLCLLIGEIGVFMKQIRKVTLGRRKTFLTELIQREIDEEEQADFGELAVHSGD